MLSLGKQKNINYTLQQLSLHAGKQTFIAIFYSHKSWFYFLNCNHIGRQNI